MATTEGGGGVSASMIILVLIATAIGAVVALVLDGLLPAGNRLLSIIAGFAAVVLASIARYKVVFLGAGRGADESRVPTVLLVNAGIASIAGSLAAHDLWGFTGTSSPGVLGALAGLLSAILMATLMVTYHTNQFPRR